MKGTMMFSGLMMALTTAALREPHTKEAGARNGGNARHKNAGLTAREKTWRDRERELNRAVTQGVASS